MILTVTYHQQKIHIVLNYYLIAVLRFIRPSVFNVSGHWQCIICDGDDHISMTTSFFLKFGNSTSKGKLK